MTSHVSPQCFPSQKIQTGSLFSLSYQCFSLFGRTPPLSPGASSTLCLFNHCWRLFIKDSISQFSQFSSVCTISDLTCGTLLRVDIANPLSIWASPMHCQQHIVVSGHALVKFLNLQVIGSFDDRKVHYFFYVCVHNKLALAILGFQSFLGYLVANFTRLQVCYLCSYVWIDHFKQIAKFFFCADPFVVDLCDKHVLESHPWRAIIWTVLLSIWVVLLWLNGLVSPVPAIYASPLILHQFSPATYIVRALLVTNATQLY